MPKQFDLEAFKAFVASKPAGETYDPSHPAECALAKFGLPWVSMARNHHSVPQDVFYLAIGSDGLRDNARGFYTFGALASRLATLSSERNR